MKLNNVIFFGSLSIIFILILCNLQMNSLKTKFNMYCIHQYNINDSCPCISQKNQPYITPLNLNFTSIPHDIGNQSASLP